MYAKKPAEKEKYNSKNNSKTKKARKQNTFPTMVCRHKHILTHIVCMSFGKCLWQMVCGTQLFNFPVCTILYPPSSTSNSSFGVAYVYRILLCAFLHYQSHSFDRYFLGADLGQMVRRCSISYGDNKLNFCPQRKGTRKRER